MIMCYNKHLSNIFFAGLAIIGLLFSACDISDNEIEPDTSFTKVYQNGLSKEAFYPLSITQTADSGFLILAGTDLTTTNFKGTYLLKVDSEGAMAWEQLLEDSYLNPIAGFTLKDGRYQFFCMDLNLTPQLLAVNHQSGAWEVLNTYPSLEYPLAASPISDGGYLLQSYNREDEQSVLTRINSGNNVVWSEGHDVGTDQGTNVEEDITRHLIGTIPPLPFLTGEVGSSYFFNGFFNYSFSMVFVNAGDGMATNGVINGSGTEDAISAALQLSGSNYAMARYSFTDNQLIPDWTLDPGSSRIRQ